MPSVVHVITTGSFAGVERYVCDVASEIATQGWKAAVVGGDAERMPAALHHEVSWLPGATPTESLRSLAKLGRRDVCHAHLTIAETLAVTTRPLHKAHVISTRHIAARRGSSRAGRLLAPWIAARLTREIAVSGFVAERMERPPDAVISNGVRLSPCLWKRSNRVVLVLQRLEREKDTLTALRAWRSSQLAEEGWSLRVVGEGSEREGLEAWVAANGVIGVVFAGWVSDVSSEFADAGILLAPGPNDSFGFAVVEAMAAGVPVVACAAGGHLETVGLLPNAPMFAPDEAEAAAGALRSLLSGEARFAASSSVRRLVEQEFTLARHVDRLLVEYEALGQSANGRRRARVTRLTAERSRQHATRLAPSSAEGVALRELVVCSLEGWDEVWRRNQFFTDILLRRNPLLRVLFVEPPADPLFDLSSGRAPTLPRLRSITADGRLRAFRPLKTLPRRAGPVTDALLQKQVLVAARLLRFSDPILWINDVTYAPLIEATSWPSVYDVTDDWLLGPFPAHELQRLRRLDDLALNGAGEVVVCSHALAESRGARREVSLVPNGVDIEHFRRPRARPDDLPESPVAVYVGSLHDARIDIELVVELARTQPELKLALIGPNSLALASSRRLSEMPNVFLLGPRPYREVPAYLQHADVLIVPHQISPFTESLDPIKAYECVAVRTPTVATPVAGFRELDGVLEIAPRTSFSASVSNVLAGRAFVSRDVVPPSWEDRVSGFETVLRRAATRRDDGSAFEPSSQSGHLRSKRPRSGLAE
jgi:glycosyltransferase involved in cell wall biosynthesis